MTRKILSHLKNHAVAWVALFFALGGGGGFAVAATTIGTTKTVHACASKSSGVLVLKNRCSRDQKTVSLDSGAVRVNTSAVSGLNAASASIYLFGGTIGNGRNATGTYDGDGRYTLAVSSSVCPITHETLISATPIGGNPSLAPPSAALASVISDPNPQNIEIQVGLEQGGTFTPGGLAGAGVEIFC